MTIVAESTSNSKPGGWCRVPYHAVERIPDVGPLAMCVYLVLARHANERGACWPGEQRIADMIGTTDRTVRRAIRTLVSAGLVSVRRSNKGNLYQIATPPSVPDTSVRPVLGSADTSVLSDRTPMSYPTGHQCPPNKIQEQDSLKKSARGKAADHEFPPGLSSLIHEWNALPKDIVRPGNGARNPPAKGLVTRWRTAQKDSDLRTVLADVPTLVAAIRRARYCHGQGWFTLAWLFGKNKTGEQKLLRLLAGAYDNATNGKPEEIPTLLPPE